MIVYGILFFFLLVFCSFTLFSKKEKKFSKILNKQLCNTLNSNVFAQTPEIGMLDLTTNPNGAVFTVRLSGDASEEAVNGQGVLLDDMGATDSIGPPIVIERTANADAIFGVKILTTKENSEAAGGIMEIAGNGAVIFMNSAAAILRGAKLALVEATPGNVVTRTDEEILGIALDKATAINQLIRVFVTARGFAELPLYELST